MKKKVWTKPELVVHGDVEKLTRDIIHKTPGAGDVIVIGNQVIVDVPGSKVIP